MPLLMAWVVGEGIIIYRSVEQKKRPPLPADLIASSGLFVLLALLGDSQPKFAATLAWGFVGAAALNLAPTITGGTTSSTSGSGSVKTTAGGGQSGHYPVSTS